MDGLRFDSVTRAFATSRRSSIQTFLGAATGALITFRRGEEAAAGCKKVGKKCDKNKDCCDGAKCKGGKKGNVDASLVAAIATAMGSASLSTRIMPTVASVVTPARSVRPAATLH